MRVCFVVDGRSPIARNWISHFTGVGHEAHVISTYPCHPDAAWASSRVVPVAFAGLTGYGGPARTGNGRPSLMVRVRGSAVASIASTIRYRLGPLDLLRWRARCRRLIEDIAPDIVHAMRLPFEGMLATAALRGSRVPIVVSIWGNDLTLFARRYPALGRHSRRALATADAVHADCERDIRLARTWGYSGDATLVIPGSGGIHVDAFAPGAPPPGLRQRLDVPDGAPVVLNPRGIRIYVRNDTFFRSVRSVLERHPNAVFLGLSMQGNAKAESWVRRLGIGDAVRLLPQIAPTEIADLYRLADVMVSPSEHDGTPNTLLEAMACGAFPVAGDLESVREWIEHDRNGLLFDPADPLELADAVVRAIENPALRERAAERNRWLVLERADYDVMMKRAELFYDRLIEEAGLRKDT